MRVVAGEVREQAESPKSRVFTTHVLAQSGEGVSGPLAYAVAGDFLQRCFLILFYSILYRDVATLLPNLISFHLYQGRWLMKFLGVLL